MNLRSLLDVSLILALVFGLGPIRSVAAHDRPTGPPRKTRSVVHARRGMAATSQPLASQAAIEVLRRGGNAVDAAIAANAVLGVVEPMSCGIGGDLFAIVWDPVAGRLVGLNASGRAPARATIAEFQRRGLDAIPVYGPLSWSVPGAVDGWERLRSRFGTRPLADLLGPAIEYAEGGFPVSEVIAASWEDDREALAAVSTSAATFLPGGRTPLEGEIFRNPDLASSLRAIAEAGPDAFYRGAIARRIAEYSEAVDGLMAFDDLDAHRGEWVEPASVQYRGYEVWELPPNGQGIAALQMLKLLEGYDLKSMGFGSVEAIHLMVEAKKLAFEDRARHYADPAFHRVPLAGLISDEYADERRALIDERHASDRVAAGDPPQADTIYLTVADGNGLVVSLIQSNFHGFGSHHVPTGLGFALQNRGCLFALDPDHPNRLEPGKRPFHTIIPGFVTQRGRPWLSFGVMGGDMQPQGHVQVLTNLIDFGMDVQEAGDAPRWRHLGSSEPTGLAADGGGTLVMESGFGAEVRDGLRALGHRVDAGGEGGFGGYQAIRINLETGVLSGGSDPRKDGEAIGY